MSWKLVQGVPCPRPETGLGLAPAATPRNPLESSHGHDMTIAFEVFIILVLLLAFHCL